jgi:hypothetical protein
MSLPMQPGSRSSSRQSDRGVAGGSLRLGAGTPISASASSMRGMPLGATALSMSMATSAVAGALPGALPGQRARLFDSCAATAAYFLCAQRSSVLVLHHDTLAIERRFAGHAGADVLWIEVDNHSERGAGRMVASYDARHLTIVWDLFTGEQLQRVEPYEDILVAAWMRNGIVSFGEFGGRRKEGG